MTAIRQVLAALPLAGAGIVVLGMIRDALTDHGPTGLPNDLPNWHNRPGELLTFCVMVAVETAVLYRILRPRSYQHHWGRAVFALALFTFWTLPFLMLMIHSGGVMVWHFMWLIVICSSLLLLSLWSGYVTLLQRIRTTSRNSTSHAR